MVPALARLSAPTPTEFAVAPASTVKTPTFAPPTVPTSNQEVASTDALVLLRAPTCTLAPDWEPTRPPLKIPVTVKTPPKTVTSSSDPSVASPLSRNEAPDWIWRLTQPVSASVRPVAVKVPASEVFPSMVSSAELPVPVIVWVTFGPRELMVTGLLESGGEVAGLDVVASVQFAATPQLPDAGPDQTYWSPEVGMAVAPSVFAASRLYPAKRPRQDREAPQRPPIPRRGLSAGARLA